MASAWDTLSTYNNTPYWTWITVYDALSLKHLDYGWVAPHSKRDWQSGNYVFSAGLYHVRAQVKADTNATRTPPDQPDIADLRVDMKPGGSHGVALKVPVLASNPALPVASWTYDNKGFWWDAADYKYPQPVPSFKATIVNPSESDLKVQGSGRILCIPKHGQADFVVSAPGTIPISFAPMESCSPNAENLAGISAIRVSSSPTRVTYDGFLGLIAAPRDGHGRLYIRNNSAFPVRFGLYAPTYFMPQQSISECIPTYTTKYFEPSNLVPKGSSQTISVVVTVFALPGCGGASTTPFAPLKVDMDGYGNWFAMFDGNGFQYAQ
jgi:hypothetical protein